MVLLQQLEGHTQQARDHRAARARATQTLGDRVAGRAPEQAVDSDVESDEAREDGGADERE